MLNDMNNKYTRWYNDIVARGKTRSKAPGIETHHIIPECLNGPDTAENKTNVTNREHFICHWLLTKMYSGKDRHRVLNALRMMRAENPNQKRYSTKITSRVYANMKLEWSKLQSEKMRGAGNPMFGREVSDEVKAGRSERARGDNNPAKRPGAGAKISAAQIGKKRQPFSDEWKDNLSKNHRSKQPGFDGSHSEETRAKQRAKAIGRKQSPETIAKKAAAVLGSKREKLLCPHCNKEIAVNGYARWHGDNCKLKGETK